MLFNSLSFAVFLPIVFILYWFVFNKRLKTQNFLLLVASYYFYACWDWRFLFLLIFSTLLDYFSGLQMTNAKTHRRKTFWFWTSVVINLGFLGVFKYYDFFATSFAEFMAGFGITIHPKLLNLILPVGISFYTFHGLSYVIDIYNDRIKPERNYIDYALFVSYFPLLVAGPIERATHLLPQIKRKRIFNEYQAIEGMRQILWGLFKKVVIADNCAVYVNEIFANPASQSGSNLVLGALLFSIQIYGDFSGYSDIALGVSRLFGIDLLKNFAFPYFSRDIAEFWRRWHISLTTWFRDYLYIPLGGSKEGLSKTIRNTFIVFLVSGFWHGANWTFIFWGFLHACYFLPLLLTNKNRTHLNIVAENRILPTFKELIHMIATFLLVMFAWIFFRAQSMSEAFIYIKGIFNPTVFSVSTITVPLAVFIFIGFLFGIEWMGRRHDFALRVMPKNAFIRWGFYFLVVWIIIIFKGQSEQFIYFQF